MGGQQQQHATPAGQGKPGTATPPAPTTKPASGASAASTPSTPPRTEQEKLASKQKFDKLVEKLKADKVPYQITDKGIRIATGKFEFGKSDLNPDAKQTIAKVGAAVAKAPGLVKGAKAEGTACQIGSAAANDAISKQRAAAVAAEAKKIMPTTLKDKDVKEEGLGTKNPLVAWTGKNPPTAKDDKDKLNENRRGYLLLEMDVKAIDPGSVGKKSDNFPIPEAEKNKINPEPLKSGASKGKWETPQKEEAKKILADSKTLEALKGKLGDQLTVKKDDKGQVTGATFTFTRDSNLAAVKDVTFTLQADGSLSWNKNGGLKPEQLNSLFGDKVASLIEKSEEAPANPATPSPSSGLKLGSGQTFSKEDEQVIRTWLSEGNGVEKVRKKFPNGVTIEGDTVQVTAPDSSVRLTLNKASGKVEIQKWGSTALSQGFFSVTDAQSIADAKKVLNDLISE